MLDFGCTRAEFLSQIREQRPFLKKQALASVSFEWHALDELLHHIEPSEKVLQLYRNGLLPQSSYCDEALVHGQQRRLLSKRRFYAELRSGTTMVLNRAEQKSAYLQDLCSEVARFSGWSATGNAYLSFGGSGTFGKHWDTHDVFAVQLIGRKRWQLFAPTLALPLSQHLSRDHTPPQGAAVLDVTLEPGDLLHIPRGWWHEVLPGHEASFHFSVGSYGPSVQDYLQWLCTNVLSEQLGARRGLAGNGSLPVDFAQLMQTLSAIAPDPKHLARFEQDRASSERMESGFDAGLFLRAGGDAALNKSSRVSLNARVFQDGNEIVVNGSRLRMDGTARAVVMLLSDGAWHPFAELMRSLPQQPEKKLHALLLEMATHEIVSIEPF